MASGRVPHSPDQFPHLSLRLAPQGVGVGVPGRDLQGRRGCPTEIDRDAIDGLHVGEAAIDLVEDAGVVERARRGPALPDDVEEFPGAGVALVLGEMVAVLGELAGPDAVYRLELTDGRHRLVGLKGSLRSAHHVDSHQGQRRSA